MIKNFDRKKLANTPVTLVMMIFLIFIFMLVVCGLLSQFLAGRMGLTPQYCRIVAVIQDLLVFILPAIVVAMLSTRLPATLLAVDKRPSAKMLLVAVAALIFFIPANNYIIEWNESWQLPEAIDKVVRELEESAQATVELMSSGDSVLSLIVSVLIVGVMAGFSEEMFFRGALQRILGTTRLNPHVVIWITAFIFSFLHFQVFGFVPRLLLGVLFGYALAWTGSLWVPIILHVLNNSIVVVIEWYEKRTGCDVDMFDLGQPNMVVALISGLATLGMLFLLYRMSECGNLKKSEG